MKKLPAKIFLLFFLLTGFVLHAQVEMLDDFEHDNGWAFIRSDAVDLTLGTDEGYERNALRFEYDFTKGTGYGGIQKEFPIELPEDFQFTFYLKAESPANNFEIKFIDSTGNNVWWVNNRNFDFPEDWKKFRIKRRHIEFAWGPIEDKTLKRIDRIEFTVASYVGGKGTLWIDELRFEALPPRPESYPSPVLSASSSLMDFMPAHMMDQDNETFWQSKKQKDQHVMVDFKVRKEFGGLKINWVESSIAKSFDIMLSVDEKKWEKVYSAVLNRGSTSFISLPEAEARYVKISLREPLNSENFGISEIEILDISESMTPNDFLIYVAKNSPEGDYPRYFLEQASYWTVSGVNYDVKEALLNEDGMVEVDKGLFSVEPMIKIEDSLYNWSNVSKSCFLFSAESKRDFNFKPSVSWSMDDLEFTTSIVSIGEANLNSILKIQYAFKNISDRIVDFDLYLLLRPFQVNPYYQFLNITGGAGEIHSIKEEDGKIHVDDKVVYSSKKFDAFGAAGFDEGSLAEFLRRGELPSNNIAIDKNNLARGVIKYSLQLKANEEEEFSVIVPYHTKKFDMVTGDQVQKQRDFWAKKVDQIKFNLPPSADRLIDTYKANLVYILINRDNNGIQPGSRSYERSWIRDGALTSSALLKSGIVKEVKDFIDWYADYQFENGKVPCVVDFRGPDPVPEHDSHGELIYLIREYFNFTKDTSFLRSKNDHVLRAVEYIESLIAERSTDHFKFGNDSVRAYYGLVPESISHEGYSEKPMHSYWDNFFTIKGLKDAAEIQKILGNKERYQYISQVRDTFSKNLYNSIDLAMKVRNIDYIPGCVELGDFDATSTTIALTPCNELNDLPRPEVYNTFNKYFDFFLARRDGRKEWINYTPYENRLIGSFIILDQPQRAHQLIEYFLNDQRPQGWYHWAEVVWKDYRIPRFIGDMPHTWVGSDFINAIRSMFVYENEYDQSLVLASALYQDWIDAPGGMSIGDIPTYYGEISFFIKKEKDHYVFSINGDVELPENGIRIKNFNGSKMPARVLINGIESTEFTQKMIQVDTCPAELQIYY